MPSYPTGIQSLGNNDYFSNYDINDRNIAQSCKFLKEGINKDVYIDGYKQIGYNGSGTAYLRSTMGAKNRQIIDVVAGPHSRIILEKNNAGQSFNYRKDLFTNGDRVKSCRIILINNKWYIMEH